MKVTIDFETRSRCDLKSAGATRYAEDPSTDILCLAYKIDDQPERLWVLTDPFASPDTSCPPDLRLALNEGCYVEAHNATFERALWDNIMVPRYSWPAIAPGQWRDSMAVCAHKGLPLGLDDAGEATNVAEKKDKRGNYLIQTLSKPKKATKRLPERWNEDFLLYQELYDYCVQDVRTEHALSSYVGDLPASELEIWQFDQKVNQRGVKIDVESVEKALDAVGILTKRFEAELSDLTDGVVETGRQVARLISWMDSMGVDVPDLQKETVSGLLESVEHPKVRRALELRQMLSRSSTAKLQRMLDCRSFKDDRARGLLQYSGAHRTGRWAGRLIQPQNFPRGTIGKFDMDHLIDTIKTGDIDLLELYYGDAMGAISSSLRGYIVADEGHELAVADFSQIEARALMTLAGQWDAVNDFKRGADIYAVMASKIFGFPVNKEDHPDERFIGKEAILGLGYQMGKDRFYDELIKKGQPKPLEFCKGVVATYRTEYEEIPRLWRDLERAAIAAILRPSKAFECRGIVFETQTNWLTARLPSGRYLWYYQPSVVEATTSWGEEKLQLQYMGYDNKSGAKVWKKIRTYGGMITENIVQAIARDLMAHSMMHVEKHGYPVILTVHDEVVSEPKKGHTNISEFEELMAHKPAWAREYPVKAEAWVGGRYRK